MIYEAIRIMAGPYLCRFMDFCLQYQSVFNILLVAGAFGYLSYKRVRNHKHPSRKGCWAISILFSCQCR